MKKSLAVLNIIFITGVLLSSYMLYTGVAPIIQGKVRVEMQNEDDINWTLSNHTVSADTYVEILNGGNYDITDIALNVWIYENKSGYGVFNMSDIIKNVPAGSSYREPIYLHVDIDQLPKELKDRLVKEYSNFTARGEISAYSIEGLGEIKVHYHNTFQWEPLLKKLDVDAANSTLSYSASSLGLTVPYEVDTSSILSGTASADIEIYNGSRPIASDTESIPLGMDYNGSLSFEISVGDTYYLMTHSEILPIKANISTDSGFNMEYSTEYKWGAPFDGLVIGDLQSSLNTAYVPYSFTNNYTRDLDLSIEITAYDSSGSVAGHSTDTYTAYTGEHISRTASVSVSTYPSYAVVKVTENISGWTYEFRRDV